MIIIIPAKNANFIDTTPKPTTTPHFNTTNTLTVGLALEDLGGNITRSAALAGDGQALGVGRKAKVGQLDVRVVALAREQKVLGLQVSVGAETGAW